MATFEFNNSSNNQLRQFEGMNADEINRRLREESIIAFKVYDSCRQQECLTEDQLGPARAAESRCLNSVNFNEGDIIEPPLNAASVSIDNLILKRVLIVDKKPNPFKKGYWDIDIKYVFEYKLCFREADGCVIGFVRANSIYNKRVTLFGSVGSDVVMATDLFQESCSGTAMLEADPYIAVEAKPVSLSAEIKYCRRRNCIDDSMPVPTSVVVTIGLFTIIRLFRIVQLSVESRGFFVPPEEEECCPTNPCDFFDKLDFPMDIFAPPQKPEFHSGISSNVRRFDISNEHEERTENKR